MIFFLSFLRKYGKNILAVWKSGSRPSFWLTTVRIYPRAECQTWFLCLQVQIYFFSALYGSRCCPLLAAFFKLPCQLASGLVLPTWGTSGDYVLVKERSQGTSHPSCLPQAASFVSNCIFSMTPASAQKARRAPSICLGTLSPGLWWHCLPHLPLPLQGSMVCAVVNSGLTHYQFLHYLCDLNSLH